MFLIVEGKIHFGKLSIGSNAVAPGEISGMVAPIGEIEIGANANNLPSNVTNCHDLVACAIKLSTDAVEPICKLVCLSLSVVLV